MIDTMCCIALFTLTALPPVYLRLLPFHDFLTARQKQFLYTSYALTYILETIALWITVAYGDLLPHSWTTYRQLVTISWIPYFALNIAIIRQYTAQHIFILGMQSIYSLCIHSLSLNIILLFIPRAQFLYYVPLHFILYMALFFICLPIIRPFFAETFSRFHPLDNRYFWKYICPLPLVLCISEEYLAINESPLSHEFLIPRICLGIAGILIGVCVRIGLLQLEQHVQLYKKNYALLAQVQSMNTYTQRLEDSQLHMSVLRHNNRHYLSVLSELITEGKREEALAFIQKIGTAFATTKVEQFCTNPMINAALTVYINRAREAGIPVSVSLTIPKTMSSSIELSIVLSNLIENAIQASEKQQIGKRSIAIIAKENDHVLNIVVKNRYDGTVHFDSQNLPITTEKDHGLGMKSLILFRNETNASIFCNHENGWFSTYIQFEWQKG
ncbi:MAG: GHKL domain-containing protein [Megasphaera sp.]|nr:GHKL domain-containing protein [Megasphaera sp.]